MLLGAPGLTTSSKDATSATSSKGAIGLEVLFSIPHLHRPSRTKKHLPGPDFRSLSATLSTKASTLRPVELDGDL